MINIRNILTRAARQLSTINYQLSTLAASLLLPLLLASCNDTTDTLPDAGGQPIRFNVGPPPAFTDAPGTRVVIDDATNNLVWEEDDEMYVKMHVDGHYRVGKLAYKGGKWTTITELHWPASQVDEVYFYVYHLSPDEDCGPHYTGEGMGYPSDEEVTLTFNGTAVNQFIFRGIKPGQELTLSNGWGAYKLNLEDSDFFHEYDVTGTFTDEDGDGDIILYMSYYAGEELTYFIDGVQAGDLSDVVDTKAGGYGKRFVVYCNGEGGASAGDIEEAATMKFTVRATDDLNTFQLPFNAATGDYTLTVDWGDGSGTETIGPKTAKVDAALKHSYQTAGDYIITLRSDAQLGSEQMPRWQFSSYPTVAPMLVSMDTPMLRMGGTNLSYCFSGCTSLAAIPEGLFDNNTATTSFWKCFSGCTSLAAIPKGLFANNTAVTDFQSCFRGCTSLADIPEGLFANNTAVTIFSLCFYDCTSLADIPEGLFANNTAVTTFQSCFEGCTRLADIPEGLFANNTAVTTFVSCFRACTSLVLNPNIFCMEADKTKSTRFDEITSGTINFSYCFYNVGSALEADQDGGEAPALWNYPYRDGVTVSSSNCFWNCTKVTNADAIPSDWKQ